MWAIDLYLGRDFEIQVSLDPVEINGPDGTLGTVTYARTFANGDDTLEWAEDERVDMLVKGWGLPLTMRDR
jgi:hypothetical protein